MDLFGSLVQNPSTRLPICICVDASYSMNFGSRMAQVNEGIRSFILEIKNNIYAVDAVELCIVSFGSNARVERGFELTTAKDRKTGVEYQYRDIVADGSTTMGQAVGLALAQIRERERMYQNCGITTYKPWLILISDGKATDSIREATASVLDLQRSGRLKVLCIGVGEEANDLSKFTMTGDVIQLKDFALKEFFSWLSKSMSRQSRQMPETDFEIPELDALNGLRR